MHKDRPVTAGSKILENFISPLDATVVTRLEAAGITIVGKTKMDEFGAKGLFPGSEILEACHCGGRSGVATQAQSPRPSPKDTAPISGAVSAVDEGIATFALCNDYTGLVSYEAAMRGLCYIHPTYGTVSRYGLIPAVPSMDQIGIVCKTPADGMQALSVIAGHDPKDGASTGGRFPCAAGAVQGNRPPVLGLAQIQDSPAVTEFIKNFNSIGIELEYFDIYTPVMQVLCCAELSNNTTRYDGIKFGYRAEGYKGLRELYTKSRTEAFGEAIKLVSIIGSMVLSQENYLKYYDKAMRIRRIIKESLKFDGYDAIILPALALNALPRLCGLPAMTVPFGGGAITLIADANCEDVLFSAMEAVGL